MKTKDGKVFDSRVEFLTYRLMCEHNNEFYKCIDCNINICPLCKTTHK